MKNDFDITKDTWICVGGDIEMRLLLLTYLKELGMTRKDMEGSFIDITSPRPLEWNKIIKFDGEYVQIFGGISRVTMEKGPVINLITLIQYAAKKIQDGKCQS